MTEQTTRTTTTTYTHEQLRAILSAHAAWRRGEAGGARATLAAAAAARTTPTPEL